MSDGYWWSRYSNFDAGAGAYPHMGQVIAHYRKKRGWTQESLAVALGCSKKTAEDLEGPKGMNGPDMERRKTLVKLLGIPPALLALDWRISAFQDNSSAYEQVPESIKPLLEEDTYSLYKSVLMMGRGYLYSGGPQYIADTVENCTKKLISIVHNTSAIDREPWQELLCQFFQLSTSFALRRLDKAQTLKGAQAAIRLSNEIENNELLASSFYRRVRVHVEHKKAATTDVQKQHDLKLAQEDTQAALSYVEKVGPTLKGNIYLIASEVFSLDARDASTRKQCEKWQDKVTSLIYRGVDEEDETSIKLNKTGLHHEKAKMLLQFGRLQEARSEVLIARKTLPPDILTYNLNFFLTEAHIYMAEHDLEASAICGSDAYKIAQVVRSLKDEEELKRLFFSLQRLDNKNPQIANFGLVMGLY
ncbi:MAG: helix-turn-helix transcriptional regulator [Ktedonobacteraceae bacterium]